MKIIVAHPGKQHSYRLASALKKAGMLDTYITTIYDKETSWLMRVLKFVLDKNNSTRAARRRNPDLTDSEVVQFCQIRGVVEALLYRIDKNKRFYEEYRYTTSCIFGRKVAKYAIKHKVDAVITYDSNAASCFEVLKKDAPHIHRILDVSIAARPFLYDVYNKDMRLTGSRALVEENYEVFAKRALTRSKREIELTQDFFVPSDFVARSVAEQGVLEERIHKVPYGVNMAASKLSPKEYKSLTFLFVGQVNHRKGVHHLLKAFSALENLDANLWIVGNYDSDSEELYKKYGHSERIKFFGLVMQDKLCEIYAQVDVCIMPSLGEGMTLAGLEAMGFGLPIICTENAGLSDAVTHKENGYLIEVSSVESLKEAIIWYTQNTEKIREMAIKAQERANEFSWNAYEENVVRAVKRIVQQ